MFYVILIFIYILILNNLFLYKKYLWIYYLFFLLNIFTYIHIKFLLLKLLNKNGNAKLYFDGISKSSFNFTRI